MFFVEGTTEKVGVISFRTELQCSIVSLQRRLFGQFDYQELDLELRAKVNQCSH